MTDRRPRFLRPALFVALAALSARADEGSPDGDVVRPIGISQTRVAELTEALPHWSLRDSGPSGAGEGEPQAAATEHVAIDEDDAEAAGDAGAEGAAGSNPLAAVSVLDTIWQYKKTTNRKHANDFFLKGGSMLLPKLKLNIELHYVETNVTGKSERDWERILIKPIWFLKDVELNDTWGVRLAAGFEYVYDFDNADKGIGSGADQLGPLVAAAFLNKQSKTMFIPLLQHHEDIESGADIRKTTLRLIALQPLPDGFWAKADVKIPRDWENKTWPVSAELEAGKMLTSNVGVFVQGLAGMGGDRPFTYGAALGLRLNF